MLARCACLSLATVSSLSQDCVLCGEMAPLDFCPFSNFFLLLRLESFFVSTFRM